jgi:hypothetical protein
MGLMLWVLLVEKLFVLVCFLLGDDYDRKVVFLWDLLVPFGAMGRLSVERFRDLY